MGILSREKHPLLEFHSKKGGGLIFESGPISGEYVIMAYGIMAYGSTPYVGMTPKKHGGHMSAQMAPWPEMMHWQADIP